ncbi:hypothetical protein [Natronincola ferrireducens]|uniref:hypothetical protein n=1 Tax=Natronincola ferrireducens TaxID=393762 RepID=UPI0015A26340|nr:hypothetical protein [Natronincola ferrireducens]
MTASAAKDSKLMRYGIDVLILTENQIKTEEEVGIPEKHPPQLLPFSLHHITECL